MKLAVCVVERARASAFERGDELSHGGRKAIRPWAAKGEQPQEPRLKVWKDLEPSAKDQWKTIASPGLAYGTTWGMRVVNPIKFHPEPRQSRLDAWDKCSGLVHWDDPEGWDGEGGRRGIQDGEHMWIHGWFMSMYGKNHYNTVK